MKLMFASDIHGSLFYAEKVAEAYKNENAEKSLALGFQFDSSKVADQITACTNVVAQYYTPLMYGEVDIDSTLEEFNKQLYAAGLQDIIDEKQAQLDAWLASK